MMTVRIPLTKGQEAIVDECDAERVLAKKWHIGVTHSRSGTIFYAVHRLPRTHANRALLLHRFIMEPLEGLVVDHINHDGLDNRRCNLRVATRSQNGANTKSRRSESGFIGVRINHCGVYYGRGDVSRSAFYTKWFADPESAAIARDELAIEHFGPFAALNFPQTGFPAPPSDPSSISPVQLP